VERASIKKWPETERPRKKLFLSHFDEVNNTESFLI